MLAALTYFPLQDACRHRQPALVAAQEKTQVVMLADPNDCSFQFNPTGTAKFTNSCDIAKACRAQLGELHDRARSSRLGGEGQGR